MPPIVILIRHAQDYSLPDPGLTDLGLSQCRALEEHLKSLELAQRIELIISSPMRRTLQTAESSLGWLMERGVPAICQGQWQEASRKPCDTGTPLHRIRPAFSSFDFSQVYSEWPQKVGNYAFTEKAILQRGGMCRNWLRDRPEKVIAVVSHSAFLRLGVTSDRFANADYRVYEYSPDGNGLIQNGVTAERGGGMGLSPKLKRQPGPSDYDENDDDPSPLAIHGVAAETSPN